ncbi:hypothetical protein CQW23_07508 [Capsicum baccatum]|uniref:Uncharacterized protein n=1 Tax=Capsicum baccatum TaxID=33114 RepID=A0A2G2X6D6_CAPBA|nr:hypothetical protein CQW23_07508 [Capsicum baccatum]
MADPVWDVTFLQDSVNELRNQIVWSRWSINQAIEQCKRLAIAIEVVANPFIIFMNEPASGLVARAVAITMRSVRNIVDAGRTIVDKLRDAQPDQYFRHFAFEQLKCDLIIVHIVTTDLSTMYDS